MPLTVIDMVPWKWTPAVGRVLGRAVTLAGGRPVDIMSMVDALYADVAVAPTTALRLTVGAHDVLLAANRLRIGSDRSQIHLVDLVAALADATFTCSDPEVVCRRLFLCERLMSLSGGSPGCAPALVTIAAEFGEAPSTLLSR